MCQLHPFHGDGLIHLPGHTLSQDLGTGEAGEDTSLSPIHFFLGVTYSLLLFREPRECVFYGSQNHLHSFVVQPKETCFNLS